MQSKLIRILTETNSKSTEEIMRELDGFGIDVERPLSLEEVARKYNLTRERIRQIESKAIRRLARDKNIKKFRVSDSPDDMVFPITYYVPRNIYQSSSKNSYFKNKF